ncbi:MAG: FAD-dependent oxidoreductase, partial [Coriobacteriales bacterium]|nr:FAD-dependent oxidoreductase [Coriobacteriales bacterium]
MNRDHESGISRRVFLGLTGAMGLTVAGATAGLAGCVSSEKEADAAASGVAGVSDADGKYSWEIPPAPITDFAETKTADIVVVGAGMAGCVAALTAAQEGATVICVQKHGDVLSNGGGWAAWYSSASKAKGFNLNAEDMFNTWSIWAENRVNRSLYDMWLRESGPAMDWMADILEQYGIAVNAPGEQDLQAIADAPFQYKSYMVSHSFVNAERFPQRANNLCTALKQEAEKNGVEFLFSTPAVQLVRGEDNASGRVTAVIAESSTGGYLKINATKAVIMCAGDYANNMEMRAKWAPHLSDLPSPYAPPVNMGDGNLMALWIGGQMDRGPHCSNIHTDLYLNDTMFPYAGGTPWLSVNINGERFSNEDVPYQLVYAQDIDQPEHRHIQIYDSRYGEYWGTFPEGTFRGDAMTAAMVAQNGQGILDNAGVDQSAMSDFDKCVEIGVAQKIIFRADTLDELAAAINVSADALKKTVSRYNELCELGKDEDFGKNPACLHPIVEAPFYGVPRQCMPLGVLNGIQINTDMQIIDADGNPIKGLYAAGNNSGGNFFAGMVQPMCVPTMTLGRALCTGRVAALRA